MALCGFCRLFYLFFGGSRFSLCYVVKKSCLKKENSLKDKRHTFHQVMDRHIPNIHTADFDTSVSYIPKAGNQFGNGRLSCPGWSHKCRDFSLPGCKGNIIKDFSSLRFIGERNIAERNVMARWDFALCRFRQGLFI